MNIPGFKVGRNDFNPRPPRGGRLDGEGNLTDSGKFQSTPSARRATSRRSWYYWCS